jgi:diguanylate cyclase (GGDEF)-like protein/PAS domain S-box-containing protein
VIIFSLDTQYHYIAYTTSHKEVMKSMSGIDIEIGMDILECIHNLDSRHKARINFDRVLQGEHITVEEIYDDVEEHQKIWWENRYSPVHDLDNKIIGLTVFMIDITDRKQIEDVLRRNEARLRAITENAPDIIAEVDSQRRVLFINRVLPGFKMDEIMGQDLCIWMSVEDQPLLRKALEQVFLSGEQREFEAQGPGAHEETRWYMTRLSPVMVSGMVSRVVLIARDITERKKIEIEILRAKEALESLNAVLQKAFEHEQIASRTDNLTGIFNRRYFFEFVEYEFSMSKRYNLPVSVILFDVDNFKLINDTFGHLAGDEVLISVAKNVKEELRESDILARFGGDEFIILVANNSASAVRSLVERIRAKLEALRIDVFGHHIKITISAGIADIQPDIENPTKLVNRADQALYIAKQGGRNRVEYSASEI